MFFGKKKKDEAATAGTAPEPAATPPAAEAAPAVETPPAAEAAQAVEPTSTVAAAGAGWSPHLALGQITGLMAGSKLFQNAKLSDLGWLVVPAIRANQVAVAEARDAAGNSVPVAAVLWARVSDEVDRRLTDTPTYPPQLKAEDWASGDVPWVVLVVGAEKACGATVAQICKTKFDGRKMKMCIRDAEGNVAVRELAIPA